MNHEFKDPRSRVLWRTGRVILKGQDMSGLRWQVFDRAGARCEALRNGKRCNRYAPWDGMKHGELSHDRHGAAKTDTLESVLWSCRDCHRKRHPGLQFSRGAA
jgi:hypothetical protein